MDERADKWTNGRTGGCQIDGKIYEQMRGRADTRAKSGNIQDGRRMSTRDAYLALLQEAVHGLRHVGSMNCVVIRIRVVVAVLK